TIVVRTGIVIKKNKRNGRKQAQHIKIMNAIRDIEHPDGEWRNKDGRPDKSQIVVDWRMAHPDGTKAECIRETGLSKPTVYSWWKKIDWVELRSSMNRENMVQLSGADQQQAAQKVVVIVERIAKERGISEEEAYKMFLKGEY
ncbi:replication protein, partial [human gut metagenome]